MMVMPKSSSKGTNNQQPNPKNQQQIEKSLGASNVSDIDFGKALLIN